MYPKETIGDAQKFMFKDMALFAMTKMNVRSSEWPTRKGCLHISCFTNKRKT